jgi:hypothetical protein
MQEKAAAIVPGNGKQHKQGEGGRRGKSLVTKLQDQWPCQHHLALEHIRCVFIHIRVWYYQILCRTPAAAPSWHDSASTELS